MIVEDVTGILDESKVYMNSRTRAIHTGKDWMRIFESSQYEHIYASDLKSLVEVDVKLQQYDNGVKLQ